MRLIGPYVEACVLGLKLLSSFFHAEPYTAKEKQWKQRLRRLMLR